ncbi:MAG: hypothetical protein NTU81_01820 [Candidatus Nomurabacteria bacterium]|nr:hypothetical protein [Candidatus Nomurabacteria bacterium]
MIYILTGNDYKNKNIYLKKLYKNDQPFFISDANTTKEELFDYAHSVSLFGGSPIVVIENIIRDEEIKLNTKDISILCESSTTFVFLEEKLLAADSKKYNKTATIEDFSKKEIKQIPKINIFGIADAYARRDKIGAWVLYRDAVLLGVSSEEISGIIFWKIKTMLLNGTKFFSSNELKRQSSELLSIYHKAHRGECDFVVGIEQFILSSLSKGI